MLTDLNVLTHIFKKMKTEETKLEPLSF